MANIRYGIFRLLPAFMVLGLILAACGDEDSDANSNSDQTGAQPIATVETPQADLPPTDAPVDAQPTNDPGGAAEPTMVDDAAAEEPDDPAPELGTIDSWHNSPPLTLAELRGTPVLLVFWADY